MSERSAHDEEFEPFMEGLQFTAEPAELPPPPGDAVMVVRSVRLPVDLDLRLTAAAQARGVLTSTLLREWIELELAGG